MQKYIITYKLPFSSLSNSTSILLETIEINADTQIEAVNIFYEKGFYLPTIISIEEIKS